MEHKSDSRAIKNYENAKEKMLEALTKEDMSDDVIYLAADTICRTYKTLSEQDSDYLSRLLPGRAVERFVDGEIDVRGVVASAVAGLMEKSLVDMLKDAVIDDDDDDDDFEPDSDEEPERIVIRDDEGEIIYQAKIVGTRTHFEYMECFVDAWPGEGRGNLSDNDIRNRVKKEIKRIVCDGEREDKADLLKVRVRISDEPLFDKSLETHFND